MDLTGQNTLKHNYEVNSRVMTITLKDSSDVVLGTIDIEEARYRVLMEVLHSTAKEFYNDFATGMQRHRTSLDKNGDAAVSEFFA